MGSKTSWLEKHGRFCPQLSSPGSSLATCSLSPSVPTFWGRKSSQLAALSDFGIVLSDLKISTALPTPQASTYTFSPAGSLQIGLRSLSYNEELSFFLEPDLCPLTTVGILSPWEVLPNKTAFVFLGNFQWCKLAMRCASEALSYGVSPWHGEGMEGRLTTLGVSTWCYWALVKTLDIEAWVSFSHYTWLPGETCITHSSLGDDRQQMV